MNSNDQGQFPNESSLLFPGSRIATADLDYSLLPQFFPQNTHRYNSLTAPNLNTTHQPTHEPRQNGQHDYTRHPGDPDICLHFNPFPDPDSRLPDICFGSIIESRARIRIAPACPIPHGHVLSFAVAPVASYYGLEYSGSIFALISKTQCTVITRLCSIPNVQLHAFVQSSVLGNAISSHSEKHPATVKVDLNIYGVRDEAYSIGKILASSGIMLQQPVHGLGGVRYYNPHFLHVRECEGEHVEETPQYELRPAQGTCTKEQSRGKSAENISGGDDEIGMIFNGLTHTNQLIKRVADRGIKTALQDHQKEAIDFILRRESSHLAPELTLWDEQELESGEMIYQHTITGTRRAESLEAQGGILADEMGLGKTITTLAVIASTLDEASAYMLGLDNAISHADRTPRSKATLVIAPSSLLLDSWIDELYKHTFPGYLKYAKYHGPARLENSDSLYQSDIVLTTYATISSEMRRGKSMLGIIEWFRVVLDEAHDIRNRNTRQFEVAASLTAQYRWCLTGTPIQNSLEDLGALITFLRVPLLENALAFKRFIINQSKQGAISRFRNLRTLLESVCLRRTKEIIGLAEPIQETRELRFTPVERHQYNDLLRKYDSLIDMGVSGHSSQSSSTAKVQSFLKLRLFCNNGLLSVGTFNRGLDTDETLTYLQQIDEAVCVYCDSTVFTISNTPDTDGGHMLSGCSHLVCGDCYVNRHFQDAICPKCTNHKDQSILEIPSFENPHSRDLQGSALQPIVPVQQYPTKLLAFVKDIEQQQTHKSIAFSSWTKTLKIVCQLLESRGMSYYLVHGALSLSERHQMLNAFQSPTGANILLMTLGTGAVGLNLAAASRIYLLEPQWNPSVEQQAFGRALRLGQTEQVTIIRYIMKDTVEDSNVQNRQFNKLQLAVGGFRKRKRALGG